MVRTSSALAAIALLAAPLATLAATPSRISITMHALNDSGENGTARLTQIGGSVEVVVRLVATPTWAQPTHIHVGTCAHIDTAPEYALEAISGGGSSAVVPGIMLAQLLKGSYAVNVHESTNDLGHYVSCGAIRT